MGILREHPGYPEALTLQADIFVHQERYGEAETVARQVLESDPEEINALEVLADAYEGAERWPDLLAAVDRVLELRPGTDSPHARWGDLRQRVHARMELGDFAGALADIETLTKWRARGPRRISDKLRNEVMARLVNQGPLKSAPA